ncbi:Retrovirus-related Pol polyprotein from type-1 retrotransposable element R2 [Stylophora pistillata]|uniref:Retrovirus-related Pol polyprotein from type-1 retrotransposable element R2 n=1 Tax=Stylophora pistillata TaxID=50429 RepID=A0A2B4R9D8_STYPI|nr:Retrovirus-related Pol polyprotein from type-1 retrotransposable element R2 [Stylophora pistillata]
MTLFEKTTPTPQSMDHPADYPNGPPFNMDCPDKISFRISTIEGLFNQETTYNADVINLITQQPIKQSLCDTPTLDEVKKAMLRMKMVFIMDHASRLVHVVNLHDGIAEKILPESQSGFRPNKGTTDMIFSVRQLQEKCMEQNKPLYLAIIDLTKAFNTVARELLWDVLVRSGCPRKFINMIKLMHDQMTTTVLVNDGNSTPFEVKIGVKQGCLKGPTLFSIFISVVFLIAYPRIPEQLNEIAFRFEGKLFNLQRLRAKSKISKSAMVEFQYADDNAIAAHTEEDLQTILDAFNYAYTQLGLKINAKKTQVLFQPSPKDTV